MPSGTCTNLINHHLSPCVAIVDNDNAGGRLTITWNKNTEVDVQGYYIYRAEQTHGRGRTFDGAVPEDHQHTRGRSRYLTGPLHTKTAASPTGKDYYYMIPTAVDAHFQPEPVFRSGRPGTPADTVPPSPPILEPALPHTEHRMSDGGKGPPTATPMSAVDCNVGGVFAEGSGDQVYLSWAPQPSVGVLDKRAIRGRLRPYNILPERTAACVPHFQHDLQPRVRLHGGNQPEDDILQADYGGGPGDEILLLPDRGRHLRQRKRDFGGRKCHPDRQAGAGPAHRPYRDAALSASHRARWTRGPNPTIAGYKIYRSQRQPRHFIYVIPSGRDRRHGRTPDGTPSSGDEVKVVNDLKYVDSTGAVA